MSWQKISKFKDMERVNKGEKYWYINSLGEVVFAIEYDVINNTRRFEVGNYFITEEQAEAMARKLRAVLKGAEVLEDWQKEKIESWDVMLETKDEISKNYSQLLHNPKVQAILKGADVIEIPSEEEMWEEANTRYPRRWSGDRENGEKFDTFIEGAEWLKSKIVK